MSHHIRDIYFILLHYSIIIHQKGIWVSLRQRGGSLGFLTGRCWMADSTYDSNHFWQCLGALTREHKVVPYQVWRCLGLSLQRNRVTG